MEPTKQEADLISYIRELAFDDLLDATSGINEEARRQLAMSDVKTKEGDFRNAHEFKEGAKRLGKLSELLGYSNADYRKHIDPDEDANSSNMNMTPVQSSMIQAVGYNVLDNVLFIQFKNRKVISYLGVTSEEYEDLMAAESIGKHYNKFIKGRYEGHPEQGETDAGNSPA
jgi:hypothetical protein